MICEQIMVRLGEDDDPVDITWNVGLQKQVRKVLCDLKGSLIDM